MAAKKGRPLKLTPRRQKKLVQAIRDGNYYEAACAYAGVDYATFRRWMEKGSKAKAGPFRDFCEAVEAAQADAEVTIVAQWRQNIPDNWQAARDFLARRHPDRWGQRDTLTLLKGLAADIEKMTDADILAYLGSRTRGPGEAAPAVGGGEEAGAGGADGGNGQ